MAETRIDGGWENGTDPLPPFRNQSVPEGLEQSNSLSKMGMIDDLENREGW